MTTKVMLCGTDVFDELHSSSDTKLINHTLSSLGLKSVMMFSSMFLIPTFTIGDTLYVRDVWSEENHAVLMSKEQYQLKLKKLFKL